MRWWDEFFFGDCFGGRYKGRNEGEEGSDPAIVHQPCHPARPPPPHKPWSGEQVGCCAFRPTTPLSLTAQSGAGKSTSLQTYPWDLRKPLVRAASSNLSNWGQAAARLGVAMNWQSCTVMGVAWAARNSRGVHTRYGETRVKKTSNKEIVQVHSMNHESLGHQKKISDLSASALPIMVNIGMANAVCSQNIRVEESWKDNVDGLSLVGINRCHVNTSSKSTWYSGTCLSLLCLLLLQPHRLLQAAHVLGYFHLLGSQTTYGWTGT